MLKKTLSLLLVLTILLAAFPFCASAAADGVYTITNQYLTYSLNTKTGGFSIETLEGNPSKRFDNNIPLLYKDDQEGSPQTSYVTVRIDEKDYIFGRDYGLFGLDTTTTAPVISNDGQLITTSWTIKGYTVTQQVALTANTDSDLTGNVGIAYSVTNNSGREGTVGIRVLFDVALGNDEDAPYVLAETETFCDVTEHEFSAADGNMVQQLRAVDSLVSPKKASYLIFKGWNDDAVAADRVVIAHWANLANTRYEYEPDPYCDFTNYSNEYRIPDTAYGIYWSEQTIAPGATRDAELLYGVGNFSSDVIGQKVGLDVVSTSLKANAAKTDYVNTGSPNDRSADNTVSVIVNLDNSLDESVDLKSAAVTLSVGADDDGKPNDGMYLLSGSTRVASITESNIVNKGEVKTYEFIIHVDPQARLTAKRFYISLDAKTTDDDQFSESVARYVYLPGLTGEYDAIQITNVNPGIVYIGGEKALTLSGNMDPLNALRASDKLNEWDLYLVHSSGEAVKVDKSGITFIGKDGSINSISVITEKELIIGEYHIEFRFTGSLAEGFGTSTLEVDQTFRASSDEKYATRSYGIVALVRYAESPSSQMGKKYKFMTFNTEADYTNFMKGDNEWKFNFAKSYDKKSGGNGYNAQYEVLLTVRGLIHEMKRSENGQTEVFYQADTSEVPVTINNMLSYEGTEPLIIENTGDGAFGKSGTGKDVYKISGDGTLKVINSITVWKYKWSISAKDGLVYTLNPDYIGDESQAQELVVALGGAAFLIQSVGGFLVDLKFGVLSADYDSTDKGEECITHGVGFGGSISIPIKKPEKKNETTDNGNNNNGDNNNNNSSGDNGGNGGNTSGGSGDNGGSGGNTSGGSGGNTSGNTDNPDDPGVTKATNFSDGNLTATVNNVLFGESMDENEKGDMVIETGFVGIDFEVGLTLPKDVLGSLINNLGGIYAHLLINTIDNVYRLDAGVKIKLIECEASLAFKETELRGKDVILPDRIAFYIRDGLAIPLVPPTMLTGLGGGVSNLADTIGGEFKSLPPITLDLYARISILKTLIGDFTLQANLFGIKLVGDLTFKGSKKLVDLEAGIDARWITPWHLNMYGKISVIDGVLKGTISVQISDDLFYGYACVQLCIPDDIPLVGGKALASLEAAVSNNFIGVNFKLIGIKFGCIYYWSGTFDFGKGITLSPNLSEGDFADALDVQRGITSEGGEYIAVYGTNLHRLAASNSPLQLMDGSSVSLLISDTANARTKDEDALMFEVELISGAAIDDLTFTVNGTQIPLVEDDGNGNGNCLIQEREGVRFVYITLTGADKDDIVYGDNNFELSLNSGVSGSLYNMVVSGVDDLPEMTNVTATHTGNSSFDLTAAYTNTQAYDAACTVDVYITEDERTLAEVEAEAVAKDWTDDEKVAETEKVMGTRIYHEERSSISAGEALSVTIPASMPGGSYYTMVVISSAAAGILSDKTDTAFTFTNPDLPASIKSAELKPVGNGEFTLDIQDADGFDNLPEKQKYTAYMVELLAADGSTVDNNVWQYAVDEPITFGATMGLTAGKSYYATVKTVRETEDAEGNPVFYYGEKNVTTAPVTLPEIVKPKLLSVESNVIQREEQKTRTIDGQTVAYTEYADILPQETLKAAYTFDIPVLMSVTINGETIWLNERNASGQYVAAKTLNLNRSLEDGDYTIDFTAVNPATNDSITGIGIVSVQPEAVLAFTVDTSAPMLALDAEKLTAVTGDTFLFAQNVVFADDSGRYTVCGTVENSAKLTANDETAGVSVTGTSFTVSGQLDAGELSRELTITAADKNENTASVFVTVLAGTTEFTGIGLKIGGKNYNDGDLLEMAGNGSVTPQPYLIGADGSEYLLNSADVTWEILGENGIVRLVEGSSMTVQSIAAGDTALKFSYGGATLAPGSKLVAGLEDYITIQVIKGLAADAPQGLTGVSPTRVNGTDGKIVGTTAEMEYSMSPDFKTAYPCFDVETTGLAAGIYYVRYAETANAPASEAVAVVVPEAPAPAGGGAASTGSKNVTAAAVEHGTIIITTEVNENGETVVTVRIIPDEGYVLDEVLLNGEKADKHGTFTITDPDKAIVIGAVFTAKTPKDQWICPFIDVKITDWFYDAVYYAYASLWMNGVSETEFAPNSNVTRAMFVTVLYRVAVWPQSSETRSFIDVPKDTWYTEAVSWASSEGIVNGVSDTEFMPNLDITREQMATILYRYAKASGYDVSISGDPELNRFEDAGSISDWALEAMTWAVSIGLFKGRSDTELAPQATATRAEAATVFQRIEQILKDLK